MTRIRQIRKRDGRTVPFRREKIADAIFRAARSVGGEDRFLAEELAGLVVMHLERRDRRGPPTIEEVQDLVEKVLIETGHARTAKSYILYRDRRTSARAARAASLAGARPLVGDAREVGGFRKAALVEAVIEADGLERTEAEEVARAIEERVLASSLTRLPPDLVVALTRAELFTRGRASRLGVAPVAGVDHGRIREWLSRGPEAVRASDPGAFARTVGEAAMEQYVLEEVLPRPAAEAHLVGDLHAFDLGAPLQLTATALPLPVLLEQHLHGELVDRAGGPRWVASALGRIVDRYRPHVSRGLTLERVNVHLAPFLSHLDAEGLAQEVRQWLLLPALASWPERGGRQELELTLAADIPQDCAQDEPPAPAPPGRPLGAYADVAREVARALVRELGALARRGAVQGPRLTLVVSRRGARDASSRALLREALRAASAMGEPHVVFEDGEETLRGGRWLRRRPGEAADPLRFRRGDVSVATLGALNLVAAALRTRGQGAAAFLAEVERLGRLAVAVAAARRDLLARAGETPGRQLYALRRGAVPLVDLDAALHLVGPVGLDRAVRLVAPEADPAALEAETLGRLRETLAHEGRRHGLEAAPAPEESGEAARRFARLDAARYGEAAGWWGSEVVPTYAHPDPAPGETRREWVGPLARRAAFHRVRHRVPAERGPAVEELLAALEAASGDDACVEYALEPWPLRWLRDEAGSD